MKKVNKEILKDAAKRLMFDLEDSEYGTLLDEFKTIKEQLLLMNNVQGLDNVEPMTFPFDCSITYLREDIPCTPLTNEEVLKNAKSTKDGQIKLPKVI